MHFHSSLIHNFNIVEKVRTFLVRMLSKCLYESEQKFSFEVFDDFSKGYVSVENLAVRRMYFDLDRILFMFDLRTLIFLKSESFYLPSVKTQKNGGESIEKYPNSA